MTLEPMRGINPEELKAEILEMIAYDIDNQDRSLQKEIGPSEVGSPCPRKVSYGLLQTPQRNQNMQPKLKAYVGQGVHLILAGMLDRYNLRHFADWGYEERFYIEEELTTGEIAGEPLDGHCDVYDRLTCTVIDWKTVGPTMLKHYRASGPGQQYISQAHLYGRGWARYRGLPVDRVMLVFIPRQGELKDTYIWTEPYDERIALAALQRADALAMALRLVGPDAALQQMTPVEDHCGDCAWFAPHMPVASVAGGCPGAPRQIQAPEPGLTFVGKP